jgi:chromatin remodeling complex protein RSC6
MPRVKKSETSEVVAPVVAAAAPAPVAVVKTKAGRTASVADASVADASAGASAAGSGASTAGSASAEPPKKKTKVSAATATAAPVAVVAPVAVAVEVDASAVAAAAVEVPVSAISSDFADFLGRFQQLTTLISALKTELRSLEKKTSRELKSANKAGAKRKRKTGNRSPSGFVKPTLISQDLAVFLGKEVGTEMARTEVTREINAYIRANNLQDTSNGRKINADAKLAALLKINTATEELTYFNLQRYMSPHFFKAPVAAAATVSA